MVVLWVHDHYVIWGREGEGVCVCVCARILYVVLDVCMSCVYTCIYMVRCACMCACVCMRAHRRTLYSNGHFKRGSNSPLMRTKKTEK